MDFLDLGFCCCVGFGIERGTNEERNKSGESHKGESETNRGLMAFTDQVVIKDQIGPF